MESAHKLVEQFYEAFSRRDHATMNSLYHPDIQFFDPAFGMLQGDEVRNMWEMLCTRATDFKLTYEPAQQLDEEYYTCVWTADYTFSASGRRVHNVIKANMRIAQGRIIEHSDAFSLHRWCAQALGFKGWLFGWSGFFQKQVRKKARKNLEAFILRKTQAG